MAAVGSASTWVTGYRARTRRPMRAVLLAVILATAAGLVWFNALHQTQNGCPLGAGTPNPATELDTTAPTAPQLTHVRVLNASGVLGQAAVVEYTLTQLGFATTTAPTNDPQYPAFDLHCYGEIRFGAEGQAAARTLSVAVPCAELVRDARPDAGVDLALGTKFSTLRPNDAARTVLRDLAGLGQPVPAPEITGDLLRRARQVRC